MALESWQTMRRNQHSFNENTGKLKSNTVCIGFSFFANGWSFGGGTESLDMWVPKSRKYKVFWMHASSYSHEDGSHTPNTTSPKLKKKKELVKMNFRTVCLLYWVPEKLVRQNTSIAKEYIAIQNFTLFSKKILYIDDRIFMNNIFLPICQRQSNLII